jgi:MFS transporter, FHS family, L-fucose permease
VGVAAFTVNYLVDQGVGISHSHASLMFAFCQLTFTGGRFIGAALLRFIDTAFLLSTYGFACMACCLGVALRTGNGGIASLYMLFFFESICYPVKNLLHPCSSLRGVADFLYSAFLRSERGAWDLTPSEGRV